MELTQDEQAIIMILRTMRKATQEMNLSLMPDLNQKLQTAVTVFMTK